MPRDLAEVYEGESYLQESKSSYLSNVDYRLRRFASERLGILAADKPFKGGQRLLDVGCGTGWFLRAAKERDYQVAGFEFRRLWHASRPRAVRWTVYDSAACGDRGSLRRRRFST